MDLTPEAGRGGASTRDEDGKRHRSFLRAEELFGKIISLWIEDCNYDGAISALREAAAKEREPRFEEGWNAAVQHIAETIPSEERRNRFMQDHWHGKKPAIWEGSSVGDMDRIPGTCRKCGLTNGFNPYCRCEEKEQAAELSRLREENERLREAVIPQYELKRLLATARRDAKTEALRIARAEIVRLRSMIRAEHMPEGYDVADDATTELAVEVARLLNNERSVALTWRAACEACENAVLWHPDNSCEDASAACRALAERGPEEKEEPNED